MMKSKTLVFFVFLLKEGVFSSSFKGGKNRDVLKVALKHGDTATKQFAG